MNAFRIALVLFFHFPAQLIAQTKIPMLTEILHTGKITLGCHIDSLSYEATPAYILKKSSPINVVYRLKKKDEVSPLGIKDIYFNIDSNGKVISIIYELADVDRIQAKLIEAFGPYTHSTEFKGGAQASSMKGWVLADFCIVTFLNGDLKFLIEYNCDKKSFFTYPTFQ